MAASVEDLTFYSPYSDSAKTENRLPHWQQRGAVYFVTFRLADSIPRQMQDDWEDEGAIWLRFNPKPHSASVKLEYHRRFSGSLERWLDAGHGSCVLRQPACATIVANALLHFDAERYVMIAFAVMPNHVHILFAQNPGSPLEKILHTWKSFSARQINALSKRSSPLWQRDYFDRLVRDARHFGNCVRYIRRNPEKAGLSAEEYFLYENDLARAVD